MRRTIFAGIIASAAMVGPVFAGGPQKISSACISLPSMHKNASLQVRAAAQQNAGKVQQSNRTRYDRNFLQMLRVKVVKQYDFSEIFYGNTFDPELIRQNAQSVLNAYKDGVLQPYIVPLAQWLHGVYCWNNYFSTNHSNAAPVKKRLVDISSAFFSLGINPLLKLERIFSKLT